MVDNQGSNSYYLQSGLTPLHVASFMGCMNIVIFLLQNGASPNVPTVRGETPLHLAARANQVDIIRILLRNGADVNATAREQQTALHIASRMGNVDIVGILLQNGTLVDAATKDQYTSLHIAAKEGQEEVAAVLLDHGAKLTSTTKVSCSTLTHYILEIILASLCSITERVHSSSLGSQVWQHQGGTTSPCQGISGGCSRKGMNLRVQGFWTEIICLDVKQFMYSLECSRKIFFVYFKH